MGGVAFAAEQARHDDDGEHREQRHHEHAVQRRGLGDPPVVDARDEDDGGRRHDAVMRWCGVHADGKGGGCATRDLADDEPDAGEEPPVPASRSRP